MPTPASRPVTAAVCTERELQQAARRPAARTCAARAAPRPRAARATRRPAPTAAGSRTPHSAPSLSDEQQAGRAPRRAAPRPRRSKRAAVVARLDGTRQAAAARASALMSAPNQKPACRPSSVGEQPGEGVAEADPGHGRDREHRDGGRDAVGRQVVARDGDDQRGQPEPEPLQRPAGQQRRRSRAAAPRARCRRAPRPSTAQQHGLAARPVAEPAERGRGDRADQQADRSATTAPPRGETSSTSAMVGTSGAPEAAEHGDDRADEQQRRRAATPGDEVRGASAWAAVRRRDRVLRCDRRCHHLMTTRREETCSMSGPVDTRRRRTDPAAALGPSRPSPRWSTRGSRQVGDHDRAAVAAEGAPPHGRARGASSTTSARSRSSPTAGSTSDRTRTPACPRSPTCSTGRSCTATAWAASRWCARASSTS